MINDKLTLRALRYFSVLAQTRHFGQAAERLNITTSPLSSNIKELEQQLGVSLFERNSRNVRLTAAGHALKAECEQLFKQLDQSIIRVQQVAQGELADLTIGLISTAFWSGLGELLTAQRQRRPQQQLELIEASPQQQKKLILAKQLDIGLVRYADAQQIAPLTARRLTHEPFMVALNAQHPLAQQPQLSFSQVAHHQWCVFNRQNSASTELLLAASQQQGITPLALKSFIEPNTLMAYVAHSDNVAIVPASFANQHWHNLTFIPFDEPLEAGLWAIFHQPSLPVTATEFLNHLT